MKCKVDITDPSKNIKDGDILFNGEYLLFSFICHNVKDDVVANKNYNFYVNGEKWVNND